MKRPLLFATAALLALGAIGGAEWWQQRAHRAQIAAREAALRQLETDTRAAQRRLADAQRALAAKSAGATATPPGVDSPGLLPSGERAQWLARTRQLKQLFVTRPDQAIPELRFLTDLDWLSLAKDARFAKDDDIRRALGDARARAKGYFAGQLDKALRAYNRQSGDQLPVSIDQLIPFFDTPPDPAMLSRYAMTRSGSAKGNAMHWAIEERGLIDERFDWHYHVQASGGYGSSSGGGDPLGAKIQAAVRAYQRANQGRMPNGDADLVPFLAQPLTAAEIEQLRKIDERRK